MTSASPATPQAQPQPPPPAGATDGAATGSGKAAGPWPLSMRLGGASLLALVVLLVYERAFGGEFVYDDNLLVVRNLRASSLGAALRGFFEPLWSSIDPTATIANAYWRPLTTIILALGGTVSEHEPLGYHVLSIGLHLLASLAAWRLASRLLRSPLLGLGAGLLFALHPAHVESVAWISAVNDPLNGLFFLLALDAFVSWRDRGSRGSPWLAGFWLLPALLSKELALTIVPVALALDLGRGSFTARPKKDSGASDDPALDLLRAYGPFALALLLYYAGRVVTFGSGYAGFDIVNAGFGLTAARASQFRIEIMGGFLEHLFAPWNQEVFRQVRPELPPHHLPWLKALAFTGLWLIGTSWAALSKRRLPLAMLLALPASFSLLLLRFESAGAFPISDRYLYIPALFVAVLAAYLANRFLRPRIAFALLMVVSCALGVRTYTYSSVFADDETFFRAAVEKSPDNAYVRWGMGNVLLTRYRRLQVKESLDEAAFNYLMSLKLGTDYGEREPTFTEDQSFAEKADILSSLINNSAPADRRPDNTVTWSVDDRLQANMGQGWCHLFLAMLNPNGDMDIPLQIFQQTLRRWPNSIQAKLGYGSVLLQRGDLTEAEQVLREVVAAQPSYSEAWHNLGLTLADQHKWDEARNCFEEALRFRPNHLTDMIHAAKAAIDGQRLDLGQRHLEAAVAAHPRSIEPIHYLGMLAAVRGDMTTALARFDQVLARQPDHAQALLQKGKVLMHQGLLTEAANALGRACELLPTGFEANDAMARLLLNTKGGEKAALPYLQRAYALGPPTVSRQVLHEALKAVIGPAREDLVRLSQMDANRRDLVHALDWLELALALYQSDPSFPPEGLATLHYQRGNYLLSLDRGDDAVRAMRTAITLNPKAFRPHHDLALLLRDMPGMGTEAARLAGIALELLDEGEITDPQARDAMRRMLKAIAGK